LFCDDVSSLQAPQLVAAPEGMVIILCSFHIVFMLQFVCHETDWIDTLMRLEGLPPKLVEAPNLIPLSK